MLGYRETDSCGSFVAWGQSFNYSYNARYNILNILNSADEKKLISLECYKDLCALPLNYVSTLEKVTQIKAQQVSNFKTLSLSEIYAGARLLSLLEGCIQISDYSWDLRRERFDDFNKSFSIAFSLKSARLKRLNKGLHSENLYCGELKTLNHNSTTATSRTIYNAINKLSQKAIHDLAATAYASRMQDSAQNLLNVSTQLNLLGRTLNDHYIPRNMLLAQKTPDLFMKNKNWV